MAREYEYVVSEVQRIASLLGVDPQSPEYTRRKFLDYIPDPALGEDTTEVTKHDLFMHGGFARLKKAAAVELGNPSPQRNPEAVAGSDRVLYTRKLERNLARRDYFLSELKKEVVRVFEKNPVKLSPRSLAKTPKKGTPKTFRTVLLSDLHFGVHVSSDDVLSASYDWTIASRRLAKVCKEVALKPPVHKLRIVLGGDIIHGIIHLSESGLRPVTEQLAGAAALLTDAIDYLSLFADEVEVVCVPGNHDRMTYKTTSRSLSQRWDSYGSLLYLTLKAAFKTQKAITFSIPTSGIAVVEDLSGGVMVVAHGDVEPTSGNVGNSINVSKLQATLLQMKERSAVNKPVSVAMFGHWHTPTLQMLNNGSYIIVNGSLIGSDPYTQNSLGLYNSEPAQIVFDTTAECPVTNFQVIQVRSADRDSSLDLVVKPPTIIKDGELV